jgi:DNA-nicking Smr family endonuclease
VGKKRDKNSENYKPFENLGSLLESRSFQLRSLKEGNSHQKEDRARPSEKGHEDRLFQEAMTGVVPIHRDSHMLETVEGEPMKAPQRSSEDEALACLQDLVLRGEGFVVSDTPEYMEGVGYGVHPEIAQRLHRGDFSIQGHIDLHGLVVDDAKEAFEQFLSEALLSGKKAVLVIHGRGLSSRGKPILKTKVKEWLTTGQWRKWIIAFTSARSCDGGTGATYVLLRQRPATKRERKRARKKRGLT